MIVEEWILGIKYLILGLVQGITEPIPISSSGHLIIVRQLFGVEAEGLSFEIFVNIASLLAIMVVYRNDIYRLVTRGSAYLFQKEPAYQHDFRFLMYLVIATIPVGVIGLLFGDPIQNALNGTNVVGITLLITALALFLIRNLQGHKAEGSLTTKDAIIVGLAQAVAVTPGISRSGSTIVASMLLGMKQETALRFAFLLYIPVSIGTGLLELPAMAQDPAVRQLLVPHLLAFIASFIATYFSLRWFMNVMARGNLMYFVYYCLVVGILVILFL